MFDSKTMWGAIIFRFLTVKYSSFFISPIFEFKLIEIFTNLILRCCMKIYLYWLSKNSLRLLMFKNIWILWDYYISLSFSKIKGFTISSEMVLWKLIVSVSFIKAYRCYLFRRCLGANMSAAISKLPWKFELITRSSFKWLLRWLLLEIVKVYG
jgi:hypothetical protein